MKFFAEKNTDKRKLCVLTIIFVIVILAIFIIVMNIINKTNHDTNVPDSNTTYNITEDTTDKETESDSTETFINYNEENTIDNGKIINTGIVIPEKLEVFEFPEGPEQSHGKVIGILKEGDLVNIYFTTEYCWYQIEYGNEYGYVFGPLINNDHTIYVSQNPDENIETKELEIENKKDFETTDVLGSIKLNREALYTTIEHITPELVSITDALLETYEKYGIKPSFQLAVFCLESAYGRSQLAVNKNNICGFNAYATSTQSVYEHATYFDTKSDCVIKFGELIYNSYISNGRSDIVSISTKYCPPNAYNWANLVKSIQSRIESVYNSLSI